MQLDICFCSDKNLVDHIPVVVNSILRKNDQHDITIHLIHNINELNGLDKLSSYCEEVGVEFKPYFKKWGHQYRSPLKHNITEATMLRLYIPELIKVDRLLYLDIDLIVDMELTPLYKTNCGSTGVAIKNSLDSSWRLGKTKKLSGNCGVMMLNVETLRENDFTNKCVKFLNSGKYGWDLHDQDLINIYCDGKHTVLPAQYNIYIGQDDHLVSKNEDYIIHFAGSKKPYKKSRLKKKFRDMWDENKTIKKKKSPEKEDVSLKPTEFQESEKSSNLISRVGKKIAEFITEPTPSEDVVLEEKEEVNFGVTTFKNQNRQYASSNIGDYTQSLAQINIYKKFIEERDGVTFEFKTFLDHVLNDDLEGYNFVMIDRDNMSKTNFKGLDNVITVMNGWWMHQHNTVGDIDFDIPKQLSPIFTSFHIANNRILWESNIKNLKKHKVGCRDMKTMGKLKSQGVDCFFSGCLTTTIDFLKYEKSNDDTYVVDTKVENGFGFKSTSQMNPKWKNVSPKQGFYDAYEILKKYSNCKEVFTSRLHCYLPCLAIGVPVTFQSPEGDSRRTWGSPDRFDGLFDLKHEKDKFEEIRKNLLDYCLEEITLRVVSKIK